MKANMTRVGLAGFVFVAMALLTADSANAHCSTCPAPMVAYRPVVAQPVATTQYAVAPYAGWYPGKLLDHWRLRNYGVAAPVAPAYTPYSASYAPYTAAYSPRYTASYSPRYAAPYVSAYAPLRRTLVARPVVLSPVFRAGCSTCAVPSCGGCSACSTVPMGVSQATFNQPSTQPGCSSCATSPAIPSYSPTPSLAPTGPSQIVGPPTPQPQLSPNEPAPSRSNYPDPQPLDSNTSFEAPHLLDPNDQTAQRSNSGSPTVDVWNAVYRKSSAGPIKQTPIHQTNYQATRTQAEIDAEGWQSVPRNR